MNAGIVSSIPYYLLEHLHEFGDVCAARSTTDGVATTCISPNIGQRNFVPETFCSLAAEFF